MSLGVVWYYYVSHDENNNDGRHTSFYKDKKDLIDCDPELAEALERGVLSMAQRNVAALENLQVLPNQTKYFRDGTNFYATDPGQTQKNKNARQTSRERWLESARQAVRGCELIFLDPDNGLEIASCERKSQKKAGKFAFLDEILAFKYQSPVVVVYHHLNMGSTHASQIEEGVKWLRDSCQGKASVFALRFRPYSPRAFFILCSPNACEDIDRRLNDFLNGLWGKYWDNFITVRSDAPHSANSSSPQSICN